MYSLRVRSPLLEKSLSGVFGSSCLDSGLGPTSPPCSQLAHSYDSLLFGAAVLTALRSVDESEEIAGLAAKHLAHFLQRLEIDSQRFSLLKTPKRGVADSRFLGQPVECSPLGLQ